MKERLRTFLLMLMLTLTGGCFIVSVGHKETIGGFLVPVPSSGHEVTSGTRIQAEDLWFVRPGQTTRDELVSSFGEPWAYYRDLGVVVYYWETLDGHWIGGVFDNEDSVSGSMDITRLHYLFVKLDDRDRVQNYDFMTASPNTPTKELVIRWSKHKAHQIVAPKAVSVSVSVPASPAASDNPYGRWKNGPPRDENFFPIAVWLQPPARARQYLDAGFNTYVGLWEGPTEEQLTVLKQAGMRVICEQNAVSLKHLNDATIIGWMHGDEPDNAQELGAGKGYGPPIPPATIIAEYQRIRAADATRPVMVNLGQGVAWDDYIGRGVRRNHPEDYAEYVKGSDIASFDIYPVAHDNPAVAGKLWFVPQGVERLVQWAGPDRLVWNCIECTRIQNPNHKATPRQVRGEVWMSLIHGSRGLIYFVHEWQPRFNESALLSDPEMLAAVTALNRQIARLAPVLNRPTVADAVAAGSENREAPIAVMAKQTGDALYLFAVGMRDGKTTASFALRGVAGEAKVEVLEENRTLNAENGVFRDDFQPWDAHVYRIAAAPGR
jgi:hypothetical protein